MDSIGLDKDKEPIPSTSGAHSVHTPMDVDTPIRDDGFGGNLDQNMICMSKKTSKTFRNSIVTIFFFLIIRILVSDEKLFEKKSSII